jgi:LDH2 family malate/lactate/ureidoglycolate dehydrogenase
MSCGRPALQSRTGKYLVLDHDSPSTLRMPHTEAHALGMRALTRLGLAEAEARTVCDHLVDNMLCGYAFAGLPRILAMADSQEMQAPRAPVTVIHETPLSALIDGGNHVGYISVAKAADMAVEKARAGGFAVVGVCNSWFSGRNSYYLERVARAGLIGIHTASGSAMVVPSGATRPALGTNPIAFALPSRSDPLIFDMGTGATMWGEVLLKALLGEDFDEAVGVDAAGTPTKSARAIVDGGVLPFGGHKGYGLSLVIQSLGMLAGARRRRGEVLDFGFLFIVFSPTLLMPLDEFTTQLAELIGKIKALPRQPGVDEIRIPSERSFREREIRRHEGVLLERAVHDRLLAF